MISPSRAAERAKTCADVDDFIATEPPRDDTISRHAAHYFNAKRRRQRHMTLDGNSGVSPHWPPRGRRQQEAGAIAFTWFIDGAAALKALESKQAEPAPP